MTHPTKAIFGSLLKDFCKVSKGSVDEALYTEADLQLALSKSEVLDFHQTLDIDGIKVLSAARPFGCSLIELRNCTRSIVPTCSRTSESKGSTTGLCRNVCCVPEPH